MESLCRPPYGQDVIRLPNPPQGIVLVFGFLRAGRLFGEQLENAFQGKRTRHKALEVRWAANKTEPA